MQGVVEAKAGQPADFYLNRRPFVLKTARAYFVIKHYAAWDAPIHLAYGDTWDALADRLGDRLGLHLWHPAHWED